MSNNGMREIASGYVRYLRNIGIPADMEDYRGDFVITVEDCDIAYFVADSNLFSAGYIAREIVNCPESELDDVADMVGVKYDILTAADLSDFVDAIGALKFGER